MKKLVLATLIATMASGAYAGSYKHKLLNPHASVAQCQDMALAAGVLGAAIVTTWAALPITGVFLYACDHHPGGTFGLDLNNDGTKAEPYTDYGHDNPVTLIK